MNEEEIFFSVIIPTYNRAGFISRAVESVFKQTYSKFEVIVIDDGSTDDTKNKIAAFNNDKLVYYYQENSERGAARNKGVELAKGDYIVFLDSDDFLYEHFLANALESLKKYDFPGFLYMGFELVNKNDNNKEKVPWVNNDNVLGLIKGNILGCVGPVIRKNVAQQHKFIESKNLFSGEDWELWLRITAHYGLKCDNRISAGALMHDNRSVHAVNAEKLMGTKSILFNHAFADKKVQEVFGPYRRKMEAYWDTFTGLHLILGGNKREGLKHWWKGVMRSPRVLFQKRTLAIIKRFIIG